jgi:hypothetical protein
MKKFHIALSVSNIEQSALDYSNRLGKNPDLIIPGKYALWRTEFLNVSIRRVPHEESAKLRHLGWENPEAPAFTTDVDSNGILWEEFTVHQQALEIENAWPGTAYRPDN